MANDKSKDSSDKKDSSNSYKDLVDSVQTLIKDMKASVKKQMPALRKHVDYIIKYNITSHQNIESLLDTLLETSRLGCGNKYFKRLNDYYSKICPEGSLDYAKFYKEYVEEND